MKMRILVLPGLVSTMAVMGGPALSAEVFGGDEATVQQRFTRMQVDLPRAKFRTEGALITRIYGQPLSVGASPFDSAEQFRLQRAELFGMDTGDLHATSLHTGGPAGQPIMYDRSTGKYKFTLFRYAHEENGIPVFRSELRLLVRNAANSPVVLASSSLRSLKGFVPDLAVVGRAMDPTRLGTGMERFSQPQQVIWAGLDGTAVEPRLAYTFIGRSGGPNGDNEVWRFVVDAITGDILHKEDMIIRTDVTGNIAGMATEGLESDICAPEGFTPMPYATATIQGGNTSYADAGGDYTIANGGTSSVTVVSPTRGQYFSVVDFAAPGEVLTQQVTPPGPADFLHNAANTSEYIRAQTNAYIHANVVRDFALTYNPSWPAVAQESGLPININRTDVLCPGNAWYNQFEQSINFCSASATYANTAFASIVHHEYGHRMLFGAASSGDDYGEGASDCVALLIADDPKIGYGYLQADCNSYIRNADNTIAYPCSGSNHYCGQVLSGCVWSTRNELAVTNPGTYLDILSNLMLNSMFLHSGVSITPDITIDFLILDDDDGNLGNGTPHWNEICTGFGAHNMGCPPLVSCNVTADCDDGLYCTGNATCVSGLCVPGNSPCDDGVPCTADLCDESTDTCSYTPDEVNCPFQPCSDRSCHPLLGYCIHTPNDAVGGCDDGVFCNGLEFCSAGACAAGGISCPGSDEGCDEIHDVCVVCDDNGTCELGEDCDTCPNDCAGGGAICGNTICEAGDGEDCLTCPEDCNGKLGGNPNQRYCCGDGTAQYGVTCTDGRCTANGNTCTNEPAFGSCCGDLFCEGTENTTNCAVDCDPECQLDSECSDGDPCTVDMCITGYCANPPLDCDDGSVCTTDSCVGGVCVNDPVFCDDGDPCTVNTCDPFSGCQFPPVNCNDGNACTADSCDNGTCLHAWITCDDGDLCTWDSCDTKFGCQYSPVVCEDNDACTANTCSGGACSFIPINCDDGDACTSDSCHVVLGCINTPMICDDSDACTADSCSGGVCSYDPITCDDGDGCTTDSCDTGFGCIFTPIDCDDGDACTTDTCSGAGACGHNPIACDDGDECTSDSCDPASGCVYTPIPGCGSCKLKGQTCTADPECCSNKCRGGSCK